MSPVSEDELESGRVMDAKVILTIFGTIFLAEFGDKTQLATLLYAADSKSPKLTVFIAASSALILAVAIGVLFGSAISRWVEPKYLRWLVGFGFIAIGAWTIFRT
jgi:putative Ca2+/H+ antiporter (TMEM165/GDT1 family)